MLVRFVVENIFSFGVRKEFNLISNDRLKTLNSHKYNINSLNLLKISSIYGANGAGKSNLVKSLELLQRLIVEEKIPVELKDRQFKFQPDGSDKKQILAIEFIQEDTAFYYGVELLDDLIATEELYLSGLGQKEDKLIFERKTNKDGVTEINFSENFEHDEKSQLLKSVLLEDFVEPDKVILTLLSNRDNKFLQDVKKAVNWFANTLRVLGTRSKPGALVHKIQNEPEFRKYAEDTMRSFDIGITSLTPKKTEIHKFFGADKEEFIDDISKSLKSNPSRMIGLRSEKGSEIIILKEGNDIWVEELKIEHTGEKNKSALFELDEESDGTIRLLDFIPAFHEMLTGNKVFVIDEIERSIHPLLIKELVKKFSLDSDTKGQLIFTTHESNLLDQEIFRQDEIWFAEKDKNGSTDLYSLNDFKEHKTIDIRKGYLKGRYGSIPFLANLQDLNWHKYDTN